MTLKRKKLIELGIFLGHEGIYYFRDLKYIIRAIRKIAKDLPKRKNDIDWLQMNIEFFLILNSRFYDDLIKKPFTEFRNRFESPENLKVGKILKTHEGSLSNMYHQQRYYYRRPAAHGTSYLRTGVPEFGGDVLPEPLSGLPIYKPDPALFAMAKRKDLIGAWRADMLQCADEIEEIIHAVISRLNSLKDQLVTLYEFEE